MLHHLLAATKHRPLRLSAVLLSFILFSLNTSADELIDALNIRNAQVNELQGSFKQNKRIAQLPLPLLSQGRFHYTKATGLIWSLQTPIEKKIIIDAQPNAELMSLAGIDAPQAIQKGGNSARLTSEIFLGVLAGELTQLEQYFEITSAGDLTHWSILLTPRNASIAGYISNIKIDGAETTESIEIYEGNGDVTRIELTFSVL